MRPESWKWRLYNWYWHDLSKPFRRNYYGVKRMGIGRWVRVSYNSWKAGR